MKKIIIIPEKIEISNKKLRVAAYCRVSTFKCVQRESLNTQIKTYTKMIKGNNEWEYLGVFYDIGSGLNISSRLGLKELLELANHNKVDYIITKSISRLARNTVDLLEIVRNLSSKGVNIYFEIENINSIEKDKEILLTYIAMFAQEESRNMSENIRWGYQRKFENGDSFVKYKNFTGYTCVDGEMTIVEEQANIVRLIYKLYLDGYTLMQIKNHLENNDILTVTGKKVWDTKTIYNMLKNEKYKGDSLLQKTYTKDFLTGKRAKNTGQRVSYYVTDSHKAIIEEELFNKVQDEIKRRSRIVCKTNGVTKYSKSKYNGKYFLGNLLKCGNCGASYRRRTERGKVLWRCATRIEKGRSACNCSPTVNEDIILDILNKEICNNNFSEKNIMVNLDEIVIHNDNMIFIFKDGLKNMRYNVK